MVRPPGAASAPSWAEVSMPAAMPLATARPDAASARAKAKALPRPAALAERLPTTATPGCQSRAGSPATNSASGGLAISRSSGG